MTAAEQEAAYKASLAETDRLKQQWHDALIAESPFRVGDRVDTRNGYKGTLHGWEVLDDGSIWWTLKLSEYAKSPPEIEFHLTRIDEHGNPLPPREKGEA